MQKSAELVKIRVVPIESTALITFDTIEEAGKCTTTRHSSRKTGRQQTPEGSTTCFLSAEGPQKAREGQRDLTTCTTRNKVPPYEKTAINLVRGKIASIIANPQSLHQETSERRSIQALDLALNASPLPTSVTVVPFMETFPQQALGVFARMGTVTASHISVCQSS